MRTYKKRRRAKTSRLRLFWIGTQITFLLAIAIFAVVIGVVFLNVSSMLPSGKDIEQYKPAEATKILSSDGVVLAELYEENREYSPLNDIPIDLQNATVAIEDFRFYKHPGVDIVGIARAVYQNFRTGSMGQGGSTLTQQLARNIYLTREKKMSRKLQEMALAIQLERKKTKHELLEMYLNKVYYGSGAFGVQTASKVYFGKDVKELSLSECALIAGLTQKPSGYSPHDNYDTAIGRRNVVLNRMVTLGYINKAQRDEAVDEHMKIISRKPGGISQYKAPWFVAYVLKELSGKYDENMLNSGGFKVYTTLNYEMQKAGETALRDGVKNAKWQRASQGALICIDPANGYIKAMVGGVDPDYVHNQYNRVTQAKRQPGSTFKAFVYTAAIDNGYSPDYHISNSKITYPGYGGKPWTPKNDNGRYGGNYSIKYAVANSINVCAVRMADIIGIDEVIKYARLMGIKSDLSPTLSLALGASEVTPLEMCAAYGVFAANGMKAEPMSVIKIVKANATGEEDSLIGEYEPKVTQVLSEETTEIMNDIFRGVVTSGTARRGVRGVRNAHGKTGTTSNDRNAWFVGYTPELSTAVWVGNDDNTSMRNAYGGNVCAPIWSKFMQKALVAYKDGKKNVSDVYLPSSTIVEKRIRRDNTASNRSSKTKVNICSESGLLASSKCPRYYKVSYDKGTEPTETCTLDQKTRIINNEGFTRNTKNGNGTDTPTDDVARPRTVPDNSRYVTVTICADSGYIANEYCQETITRRYKADEAPTRVCRIHSSPD
ncbi:MAG: transglycosylase domain-containing protein [Armatimonadota bacterium]